MLRVIDDMRTKASPCARICAIALLLVGTVVWEYWTTRVCYSYCTTPLEFLLCTDEPGRLMDASQ